MFHVKPFGGEGGSSFCRGKINPLFSSEKAKQRPDGGPVAAPLWMWGVKEKDMDI